MIKIAQSLVVVPSWLDDVANHYRLTPADKVDLLKLQSILLPRDVGLYIKLNLIMQHSVFTHLFESFLPFDWMQYAVERNNKAPIETQKKQADVESCRVFLHNVMSDGLAGEASAAAINTDVIHAMVRGRGMGELTPPLNGYVYEMFALSESVYGVKFIPAVDDQPYDVQLMKSVSDAIQLLRATHELHEVAGLPLMSEFVRLGGRGAR